MNKPPTKTLSNRPMSSAHMSESWIDSKSSFEKKLRQWGLTKYGMGQHKWKAVGRILERRERAGKKSDVYVRGVMVSRDKVTREVSRHVPLTLRSKFSMETKGGYIPHLGTHLQTLMEKMQLTRLNFRFDFTGTS